MVEHTPYFIPQTQLTFNAGKPRSVDLIENGYESIKRLIYESSRVNIHTVSVRLFHKYILLRNFIKYSESYISNKLEGSCVKLRMLILLEMSKEITSGLRYHEFEFIDHETMIFQGMNTLVYLYYDEDPDKEELENSINLNQYRYDQGKLVKGSDFVCERLMTGTEITSFIAVHMPESFINKRIIPNLTQSLFGFMSPTWRPIYIGMLPIKTAEKKEKIKNFMKALE